MLLRPADSGTHHVVGECFVHGLMDAESILGSIPSGWRLELHPSTDSTWATSFTDLYTKEHYLEDPRLLALPAQWRQVQRKRTQDDPFFFQDYRNDLTDEVINSDPRIAMMIKERKIALKPFRLV